MLSFVRALSVFMKLWISKYHWPIQGSKLTFKCTCKFLLVRFFSTRKLVRPLFPFVWETWMILTRKRFLVDIFSLADYQNLSRFVSLWTLILSLASSDCWNSLHGIVVKINCKNTSWVIQWSVYTCRLLSTEFIELHVKEPLYTK